VQGGIPQCSELLSRYAALLVKGERALPQDYAEQALREGRAEAEIFYSTPNATSHIDFPSFTSSVARLIGCEPSVPMWPSSFIKFWTLPLWTYFYRLDGPGAKPAACRELYGKFRMWDSLVPMPLLALFVMFSVAMQPLVLLDYLFSPILNLGLPSSAVLPRLKNWRVGAHFHQLSGNGIRLRDGLLPSHGFMLLWALITTCIALLLAHCEIAELAPFLSTVSQAIHAQGTAIFSALLQTAAPPAAVCHWQPGKGCVPAGPGVTCRFKLFALKHCAAQLLP